MYMTSEKYCGKQWDNGYISSTWCDGFYGSHFETALKEKADIIGLATITLPG
jgi:hypothetical protein